MEINWAEYKKFLEVRCKNKKHINNLLNFSKKYGKLIFSSPLEFTLKFKEICEGKRTMKRHLLQALASFARYLDLKHDSSKFYSRFRELREKAGIKWGEEKVPKILEREIEKEEILEKIKRMEKRLKATSILHLLTGLRTAEFFFLIKNFEKLRKKPLGEGWIIELNYLRRTKKVFLTFLHSKALDLVKLAYRNQKSYWKNLKKHGVKAYDFRRIFESIYEDLRSHEIDLLQGRIKSELVMHYTRDISSLANKILKKQAEILEEM